MKGILIILTLLTCKNVHATNWGTFYVYFETEYIQGPWTRADILEKSNYKYLAPKVFEGLFGSEDADLINTMLVKLKENNPKVYNWHYDLVVQNDTVILTPKSPIPQYETVKNEITATLTLNNFKAVIFNLKNTHDTLSIKDLTLPYFDLVEGNVIKKNESLQTSIPTTVKSNSTEIKQINEKTNQGANSVTLWLIISGILNIGLILLIIRKNKKG